MSIIKNLYSIETGNFKLDGGAMFGVVPKTIWEKTNPADDLNMINMAARSLLIETNHKLILIDTGLGDKQSENFFSHYYRWCEYSIDASIKKAALNTAAAFNGRAPSKSDIFTDGMDGKVIQFS